MAKFEVKYDKGDIVYCILYGQISKVKIIDFNLSYDTKLSFENRIQYKVECFLAKTLPVGTISISLGTYDTLKKANEVYDTMDELVKDLTLKHKEKYG